LALIAAMVPNSGAALMIRLKCLFDKNLGKSVPPEKFSHVAEKRRESILGFAVTPGKD
jgi:hypothetical protein